MIRQIFLTSFITASTCSLSYGQCCSAGNPASFTFNDQNSLKEKSLVISTTIKYFSSKKYLNGIQLATILKTGIKLAYRFNI
jgi:hypothetical protein